MFWFFGYKVCGILGLPTGIEPSAHALEAQVFITRPPWSPEANNSNSNLPVLGWTDFGSHHHPAWQDVPQHTDSRN